MTTKKLNEEDPNYQLCTGYQHQFNVLEQVSPNPIEVNCFTALKHPDKNRGDKYLPGKTERTLWAAVIVQLVCSLSHKCFTFTINIVVEQFRVMLFGERPDYIHAVTANVRKGVIAYL